MFISTAAPAAPRHLSVVDWVLPDPGESAVLWEAARSYRRRLWTEMGEAARGARSAEAESERRAGVIYETIAAGQLGDLEAACELLIGGRELNRYEPMHHLNAGVLLMQAGYFDQAVGPFELAAQLAPGDPATQAYLSIGRSLVGDWTGAREAALKALELGQDVGGLVNLCLASACVELGRPIDPAARFPDGEPAATDAATSNRFAGTVTQAPVTVFSMLTADQLGEAQALVWSLKAARSSCAVHLHVVNPDAAAERLLDRLSRAAIPVPFSWSFEWAASPDPADLRRRLRPLRVVRLRAFVEAHGGQVILADPGVVFRAAPEAWLADGAAAVTLVEGAGGLILERYAGDLCAVRAGPEAEAFLRAAAAAAESELFRTSRLDRLDQAALWVGAQRLPGAIRILPAEPTPDPDAEAAGWWQAGEAAEPHRQGLLAAAGDFREPEIPAAPVNELLDSVFGPMLVNRHDTHISRAIRGRGGGEAVQEVALLRQFIQAGDTVLDVGANMGTHTVPFCQAVGPQGRVFAFEPQRVIHQVMVANVALNSCLNAHCRLAAVGAKRGKLKVPSIDYGHPGNFGLMSFAYRVRFGALPLLSADEDAGEEVEVVTLDGLGLTACHLIKIDVEGMEAAVLKGARRTIAEHRPVIYMECFDNDAGRAAIKAVKGHGYRVFRHHVVGGENVLCVPGEADWTVEGLGEV